MTLNIRMTLNICAAQNASGPGLTDDRRAGGRASAAELAHDRGFRGARRRPGRCGGGRRPGRRDPARVQAPDRTLADGRAVFVKAAVGDGGEAPEAFAAEANGLRWLARAGAVPVPAVLGADESTLVIELLPPGEPTPGAARDFGAALARMHAAGANGFGAPWPGYIASLPLDNTPLDSTPLDGAPLGNAGEADWGSWYAERRLVPYLRRARDGGALSAADARPVEAVIDRIRELAGPPSRRVGSTVTCGRATCSGRAARAR